MYTNITFSTTTSSYTIWLPYSKIYKNKVWNKDVLILLKAEFKPKGRLKAVRASIGKNRFLTKSLRLTKRLFFQYCHWYQGYY